MSVEGRLWVVVLAGGIGSRFWPVSTPERPKQLLPLASDQPLISDTIDRARALVPDDRIRILAGRHLVEPFRTVLTDLPDEAYWLEPRARGTGPVLAWAAYRLAQLDPDAVMVSLHADHLIEPVEAFADTVRAAATVADREDMLVCVGVAPDRVETGYGHIEPGEAMSIEGAAIAHRVTRFHEKPEADAAKRYVERGFLWNTGIFVWKARTLLDELERHAPEVSEFLPLLDDEDGDQAFFSAVPVSVIDRVAMERSERVATVQATFTWDDVGSWEALSRTRPRDDAGNVTMGEASTVEASGNLVYTEDGRVVLFGTQDLVVVRTADTTLVMPRSRAAELKTLLREMEDAKA